MFLIPVLPKGWESPQHTRTSQPCRGDSLAAPAHADAQWDRLRAPCLGKASAAAGSKSISLPGRQQGTLPAQCFGQKVVLGEGRRVRGCEEPLEKSFPIYLTCRGAPWKRLVRLGL